MTKKTSSEVATPRALLDSMAASRAAEAAALAAVPDAELIAAAVAIGEGASVRGASADLRALAAGIGDDGAKAAVAQAATMLSAAVQALARLKLAQARKAPAAES